MNLILYSHRPWQQVMRALALALAVVVAGVGFLVPADGVASPHDDNMTSQHNALSAQQTAEHNALQTAIGNLGDHSGLPQAWDKILPANDPGGACPSNSSRFTCVMGGAAVRDNETGLVWEQSPSTSPLFWNFAGQHCINKNVGGRKGWRLPSVPELASLVDPTQGPALPPGHPFNVLQSSPYWSATINVGDPALAWLVLFANGFVAAFDKATNGTFPWCVRGAMNADQY